MRKHERLKKFPDKEAVIHPLLPTPLVGRARVAQASRGTKAQHPWAKHLYAP
jgi:hypothetical protein